MHEYVCKNTAVINTLLYCQIENKYWLVNGMYRDVQKVFGHCNFFLYISYKTTHFFKTLFQSQFVFDFDDMFTNRSENVCSFL